MTTTTTTRATRLCPVDSLAAIKGTAYKCQAWARPDPAESKSESESRVGPWPNCQLSVSQFRLARLLSVSAIASVSPQPSSLCSISYFCTSISFSFSSFFLSGPVCVWAMLLCLLITDIWQLLMCWHWQRQAALCLGVHTLWVCVCVYLCACRTFKKLDSCFSATVELTGRHAKELCHVFFIYSQLG